MSTDMLATARRVVTALEHTIDHMRAERDEALALHPERKRGAGHCSGCGKPAPCPTVAALGGVVP